MIDAENKDAKNKDGNKNIEEDPGFDNKGHPVMSMLTIAGGLNLETWSQTT